MSSRKRRNATGQSLDFFFYNRKTIGDVYVEIKNTTGDKTKITQIAFSNCLTLET